MKFLALLFLPLFLSCNSGLSEKEKDSLDLELRMHRVDAVLKYKLAAVDAETNAQIKYITYEKKDALIKLTMDQFDSGWNRPYDIRKDTTLTLDQYLNYCKANGFDPVQYIDVLRDRAPSK